MQETPFLIAGEWNKTRVMLMLLSDFFDMLAMAVFACIGGVFLGIGFLLLKLAGILFGILAGCIILMEAAGRWIFHLMGA